MNRLALLVVFFTLMPTHSYGQAKPELEAVLSQINTAIKENAISASDCPNQLNSLTGYIHSLDPSQMKTHSWGGKSERLIQELFQSRIRIREELKSLSEQRALSFECVKAARAALRHLRGIEDYLGMVGYQNALKQARDLLKKEDSEPNSQFTNQIAVQDATRVAMPPRPILGPIIHFPQFEGLPGPSYLPRDTLVNPNLKEAPGLKSGDILLSRGNANVSALIARMADDDTQFSHLALIYVDPITHAPYTIEAHIEHGSVILPLSEWLKDGKVRTVVFRQKDSHLAALAARHMFETVKRNTDLGRPIEYDFSFNMNDHRKLFCSEVVRTGYEFASSGSVMVPAYPSRFTAKNRDLFERMGIEERESFLPEDIEMDPRFQLLAEWRNFRDLGSSIRKDAILSAAYDWMEHHHYHFDPSASDAVKAGVGKVLRQAGFFKDKMPTYMTYTAIETSIMVDNLVSDVEKTLAPREAAHRRSSGLPFTYLDFERELRLIRLQTERSKTGFYRYFHP